MRKNYQQQIKLIDGLDTDEIQNHIFLYVHGEKLIFMINLKIFNYIISTLDILDEYIDIRTKYIKD